jgi:uncharacterized protein YecE (DUF72 family)
MYPDWRGRFYPPGLTQREWFAYYAGRFDTVELNTTFYRLPSVEAVERWAALAPAGFTYALKLGAFGSHRMKLRDAASWLPNHLDRARRLGRAQGPTLVQLPPGWKRDAARLDDFLAAAGELGPDIRWSVELRDARWLHDDVFDALRRHGAALCIHDLLADHPWERTADWTYVRFHGPHAQEHAYHGRYTGRRLWRAADRLASWRATGADVYVYFNNDVDACAVDDARWLRERLRREG